MNIDALEQQVAAAKKQLSIQQKMEAKKNSDADIERVRIERLAQEKLAEQSAPLALGPVQEFYLHCKKEPREILEARYSHILGINTPLEARHDYLATRSAYHFQILYYQAMGRPVPAIVARRALDWALTWPHGHFQIPYDAQDPPESEWEIWDDTRVVAAAVNPYSKGAQRAAFFTVEAHGAEGVAYGPLCKELEAMLDTTVDSAANRALEFFTKYVRENLTKIIIIDA